MGQSTSSVEQDEWRGVPSCGAEAPAGDGGLCHSAPTAEDVAMGSWICTSSDPNHEVTEAEGDFGRSDWQLKRVGGKPPPSLEPAYGLSDLQLHRSAAQARQGGVMFQRMDTVKFRGADLGDADDVSRMNSSDSAFGLSDWQLFHVHSARRNLVTPSNQERLNREMLSTREEFVQDAPLAVYSREKRCRICTATGIAEWCNDPQDDVSQERPG